ncbi:MAG TPA: alpha/beta fold hydrolase [Stellaceae bacterium]|nr:alpha/beta fold hydrolase [Stellaceae bacterium]
MTDPSFRPLPAAEIFTVNARDGAVLPVYAVGGPPDTPALLFAHANGFAVGSYEPWLRALAGDFRVFAYDARGHGGAQWPEGPLEEVFHVDRFADDLAEVAAACAARLPGVPLHYCGHSLGAAAALRLLSRGGAPPWVRAILCEPPIFPPRTSPHFAGALAEQQSLIARSAVRRSRWAGPPALAAALNGRGPFARFRPEMLEVHCRATLRPTNKGDYALACPPAVESVIFESHRDADTWQRLGAARGPILLVSGDPSLADAGWIATVLPDMTAAVPGARLQALAGAGHLMIFEEPERCRVLVLDEVRRSD